MNYPPNTITHEIGALVLHDCDAKRRWMLMRVVEYLPDGRVRTEYLNSGLRKEWGRGKRSILINPLADLHPAEKWEGTADFERKP